MTDKPWIRKFPFQTATVFQCTVHSEMMINYVAFDGCLNIGLKLWLHVQFLNAIILDSGGNFSCQSIFSNTFDLPAILAVCCNS